MKTKTITLNKKEAISLLYLLNQEIMYAPRAEFKRYIPYYHSIKKQIQTNFSNELYDNLIDNLMEI